MGCKRLKVKYSRKKAFLKRINRIELMESLKQIKLKGWTPSWIRRGEWLKTVRYLSTSYILRWSFSSQIQFNKHRIHSVSCNTGNENCCPSFEKGEHIGYAFRRSQKIDYSLTIPRVLDLLFCINKQSNMNIKFAWRSEFLNSFFCLWAE